MGVRWEEQVDELMWERSGALEERSAGKEGRWRLSSGEQGGSWETSSPRRSTSGGKEPQKKPKGVNLSLALTPTS